jgi:hypothetical protein
MKKNKKRNKKKSTHNKNQFQELNNPRELFRKLALQIAIGIVIIIPFFNTTSIFRFVALAGFLITVHGIVKLVQNSEAIIFHYFPSKYKRKPTPSSGDKIIEYIASGIFGLGLLILLFRIVPLDNTIGGLQLFFISAGLGFGLGVAIAFMLKSVRPSAFHDSSRRMGIIFGYALGLALLFASLASIINEEKASDVIVKKEVQIVSKSSNTRKVNSYYIFILIDGDQERIELKKKAWDALLEGDMITLELKNGYFNYPFITNFEKIKAGQW